MRKLLKTLIIAACLTGGMCLTVMAGQWERNDSGWWYQEDDGSYYTNGWQWIDGNGDGISECYYFDSDGYLLVNTTTPDGYLVNGDGAWVINGVVQTLGEQPDISAPATTPDTYIGRWNREYYINSAGGRWDSPKQEVGIAKRKDGSLKLEIWSIDGTLKGITAEYDFIPLEDGVYMTKADPMFAEVISDTYYYANGNEMIAVMESRYTKIYEYFTKIQ